MEPQTFVASKNETDCFENSKLEDAIEYEVSLESVTENKMEFEIHNVYEALNKSEDEEYSTFWIYVIWVTIERPILHNSKMKQF